MSGLAEEFRAVTAANVDATTPEGQREIAALGFDTHGLAVRSPAGEVLFKQRDHTVDVDAVRQEIRRLLAE